ncbi:MAG: hypothetical protein QOI11_1279, partial [Candidatus Eremiobacteraeota bacterium]|nr:hypothetical protein [Candidatus Eremiobacteraeota bacterium]
MPSKTRTQPFSLRAIGRVVYAVGLVSILCLALMALLATRVLAAQPPVGLGTADSFAVLAGSAVTNTGPSTINGNLGVTPGTSVTGFPPGTVNGTIHIANGVAGQAQSDLTTAYNDAAGRTPPLTVTGDLGGLTLTPGVYKSGSSLGLTGPLTLNAQGNPDAVFIFQAGSSLTTASGSHVNLVNGAQPCNVYWQIGSSATLGSASVFAGNLLALTSITMNNAVTVYGRALARNGAVTLINDTITPAYCATAGTPPGTTPPPATPAPGTPAPGTPPPGTPAPGTPPTTTVGGIPIPIAIPGIPADKPTTGTPAAGKPAAGKPAAGNGSAIFTTNPRQVAKTVARYGTSRCVDGFQAVVNGLFIRRVVFTIGGRVIATRSKAPFTVSVGSGDGIRTLKAKVTFTDGTPTVRLSMKFRSCSVRAASV